MDVNSAFIKAPPVQETKDIQSNKDNENTKDKEKPRVGSEDFATLFGQFIELQQAQDKQTGPSQSAEFAANQGTGGSLSTDILFQGGPTKPQVDLLNDTGAPNDFRIGALDDNGTPYDFQTIPFDESGTPNDIYGRYDVRNSLYGIGQGYQGNELNSGYSADWKPSVSQEISFLSGGVLSHNAHIPQNDKITLSGSEGPLSNLIAETGTTDTELNTISGTTPVETTKSPAPIIVLPIATDSPAAQQIAQTTPGQSPTNPASNVSGEFAHKVGLEIAKQAQAGQNRFTIRLDPPELGRIDIRMTVSHDGHVQAALSVDNETTLDLLLKDQRGLEKALENAGLKADEDDLNFSLNQGSGDEQDQYRRQANGAHSQDNDASPLEDEEILSTAIVDQITTSSRPLDIQV